MLETQVTNIIWSAARSVCVRAALALGEDSKQPKQRVRTDRAALQNAAPISSSTNTTLGHHRLSPVLVGPHLVKALQKNQCPRPAGSGGD